jgi:hypothetical protein
VFLATHGWWPWLLLYAVIIGIVAAGGVYLLRRRRADKASATTARHTGEPAVAPSTEPAAPATPPDSNP